jgi:hypothetical protein
MKIYSYILITASGDHIHRLLKDKNYKNAIDFMKNEVPEEYEAWKDEWDEEAYGPWDEDTIDYEYFDKEMIKV